MEELKLVSEVLEKQYQERLQELCLDFQADTKHQLAEQINLVKVEAD